MNDGKKFEQQFKKSLEKDNYKVLRLDDTPTLFGDQQDNQQLRFTQNQPYDFEAYKTPYLFCLELKSTVSTSFSVQSEEDKANHIGKMIKRHQIEGLTKVIKYKDCIPLFVLNFRRINKTYLLPIWQFNKWEKDNNGVKKSINEQDIIKYHGILMYQKLIRINYYFDFAISIHDFLKKYQITYGLLTKEREQELMSEVKKRNMLNPVSELLSKVGKEEEEELPI